MCCYALDGRMFVRTQNFAIFRRLVHHIDTTLGDSAARLATAARQYPNPNPQQGGSSTTPALPALLCYSARMTEGTLAEGE
jgi:hypothetical protein